MLTLLLFSSAPKQQQTNIRCLVGIKVKGTKRACRSGFLDRKKHSQNQQFYGAFGVLRRRRSRFVVKFDDDYDVIW